MTYFKRLDILFFAYLIMSSILMLLAWGENSILLLGPRIVLIPLIFTLIYFDQKVENYLIGLLRSTYPLILSGYFYSETVNYNKIFFNNLDPYLEKLESAIFGMQPSLEFPALFPNLVFSELMYIAYFSFYLLILFFSLYVYFKKKDYFIEAVFKLSASLYIFYFIFCLFPSAGPQFYFASPNNILPDAFIFDKVMHFIQKMAEEPTGAFPSSHVGISVIILLMSRKRIPHFFNIALPFVILLIFSTIYIKAHYTIDAIAGLLIAPFILYLSDFLYHIPFGINKNQINQIIELDD